MVRREMAVFSIDSLPLGFRFRPTDVELVNHYLKGKISGQIRKEVQVIPEIDICKCEPWDLPDKSLIKSSDSEWFFFCPKDRKYRNSSRFNRATEAGYWKATGKDRLIKSKPNSTTIGMKKTLVFYQGRAPKGVRTCWIIHEYRILETKLVLGEQGDFVLCRLFKKPEETTTISDDDCMRRNVDEKKNTCVSSAPSMFPGTVEDETDASVETLTTANQNFPVFDLQGNVQHLPVTSDMQSSGAHQLLADEACYPELSHLDETVVSSNADHDGEETTEVCVDQHLHPRPDLHEFDPDDFHVNFPIEPDLGHPFYGVEFVDQIAPEFHQYDPVEHFSVTELLDYFICDPEDCLDDASNAFSPVLEHEPEGQSFICRDTCLRDSLLSVSDSKTDKVVDDLATISHDGVMIPGVTNSQPIFSNSSSQNNIYFHPTKQDISQSSLFPDQNLRQDSASMETCTSSLHQVSANVSPIIEIRTSKKSSHSDSLVEQQGLAKRQIRLQKFVHKGSAPRTDYVLSTTSSEMVKSVVSEVGKIPEHQVYEGKPEDTPCHEDPVSTAIPTSSPEICDDAKENTLRLRARWTHDEDTIRERSLNAVPTPSGSHYMIKIILVLSALLVLLFLGLSWCLSS